MYSPKNISLSRKFKTTMQKENTRILIISILIFLLFGVMMSFRILDGDNEHEKVEYFIKSSIIKFLLVLLMVALKEINTVKKHQELILMFVSIFFQIFFGYEFQHELSEHSGSSENNITFIFFLLIEYLYIYLFLINTLSKWQYKLISMSFGLIANFLIIRNTEEFSQLLELGVAIFSLMLLHSYMSYMKSRILNQFLNKVEKKMKKESQWKRIINEFQDGFILVRKSCLILHKNKQIDKIFGVPTQVLLSKSNEFMTQELLHSSETIRKRKQGKLLEIKSIKVYNNYISFSDSFSSEQPYSYEKSYEEHERPKFKYLQPFFQTIIQQIIKINPQLVNARQDFNMLVQATIINFRGKEIQVQLMIKRGSRLVQNSYMIIVYNQKDKLRIQQLEGINKMRQIMVASISHELRTPLNSMMILLQCAKQYANLPKLFYDQYIQPALDQSEYLLCLINDILDYTQLSLNHKPRFVFEKTNISNIINDVIKLMELRAKMRKIDIYAYIDPQIQPDFTTDARRIKQILLNLVGNAMKFTFTGHIKIIAKLKVEDGINYITIHVEDTGVGIEKQHQKNIFQMFSMSQRTQNMNKSGMGLGLMISYQYSKFLNKENGKGIQVESEVDVGSTFSFQIEDKTIQKDESLAMNISQESDHTIHVPRIFKNRFGNVNAKMESRSPKKNICKYKHPKILIVDDSEYNIYALMLLMKQFELEADTANNGRTAIEMVISRRDDETCKCQYKIILMDCNMPLMNGYQACSQIKRMIEQKLIQQIFIVACSADMTEQNQVKCNDYKFDDFLEKPISFDKLKEKLSKQVNG